MQNIHLPHNHSQNIDISAILPDNADLQYCSDIFKLLGDVSRLRIFCILSNTEQCVTNISAMTDMSSPAVSHHLKQLKNLKLITSRRNGKEVYYKAADTAQSKLLYNTINQLMKK